MTQAVFYDGLSARRREVDLVFADDLAIVEGGAVLSRWAYADIRRIDEAGGALRLANAAAEDTARLELTVPAHREEIARRCPALADRVAAERRAGLRIALWSAAAAASLVFLTLVGIPHAAERLAPLVPMAWEKRLGEAAEGQVKSALRVSEPCGKTDSEGAQALSRLRARLVDVADTPIPIEIVVVRHETPNAFALPGGRIVVLDALLRRARSVDEAAGVLAHEIGHVARRDSLRGMIQAGGVSFIIGLVLGDFAGGGALVVASRSLVQSAYSRDVERQADAHAAMMMRRLGRSAAPMGELLVRLTGAEDPTGGILSILGSHPMSGERLQTLRRLDAPATGEPLLTEAEWRALRAICRPLPAGG